MNGDMERRVRRFIDLADEIADHTGIPVNRVERALIYDAAKNESVIAFFLDFVHSVVNAAKVFVGEWTARAEKRK